MNTHDAMGCRVMWPFSHRIQLPIVCLTVLAGLFTLFIADIDAFEARTQRGACS